jgi:hypothetical protein
MPKAGAVFGLESSKPSPRAAVIRIRRRTYSLKFRIFRPRQRQEVGRLGGADRASDEKARARQTVSHEEQGWREEGRQRVGGVLL